jgi:hypothetical protein
VEPAPAVRPADSADEAGWLLRTDVAWWDLVRYGPPGFEAYVRIALSPGGGAATAGEWPAPRTALRTLAAFTATPTRGYAAIWEGWIGAEAAPSAPRVAIPNREMLLFTGHVDVLRDAAALAWFGTTHGHYQEPHLVWPEDRSWCMACEVDEEIEFTVGCSDAAAIALADALGDAVRRVPYGAPAPLYRDT